MSEKNYKTYQEGLIKSLIADPSQISDVVQYVSASDFNDNNYQLIFNAMLELNRDQEEITLPGIVNQIVTETPEAHIDPTWILSLGDDLTKWTIKAPAYTWAKLVKQESSRFRVKEIVNNASSEVNNEQPLDLIQKVNDELNQVSLDNVINNSKDRDEALDNYVEYVKERQTKKDNIVQSWYPSLDKYTIGWLPSQLITVGAHTSVGKTIFAANCAVAAASSGKSVLYFSLEMGANELYDRLVSSISMVNISALRTKELAGKDKENFDNAVKTLRNYKIDIDPTANVTIDYIRSKAIKKASSDDGLDMIIVDYLQLINNNNRNNHNRQEAVAEISRNMKILAKELDIPIMILVQLKRRDKDSDPDALPTIDEIRESGAIAQDSDIVILIHRKLDDESVDPKALFIIAKNRNGKVGNKISVRAKMQYATFEDRANEDESDPTIVPDVSTQDAFANESDMTVPEIDSEFKEGSF